MTPKKSDTVLEIAEPVETAAPAPLDLGGFDLAALVPGNLPSLVGEMNGADFDPDLGGEQGPRLPYVAFPQGKGAKYLENAKYTVYIGKRGDNTQDESFYHKEVPFLLIDSLVTRPKRGRAFGGRLMWPTKDTGERDLEKGVSCQSVNGGVPMPRFLGAEIRDYRTGRVEKIGYHIDPTTGKHVPVDTLDICAGCPFSEWKKVGSGDKTKNVQLCKDNWAWVIYDFTGDQMAKVSGGNAGTQMALVGRAKDAMGARFDGEALLGIEHFFRENGRKKVNIPVDSDTELSPAQLHLVCGVVLVNDQEVPAAAMAAPGQRNEAFFTLLASNNVKAVVLDIPLYPYAPEGRPEHVGSMDVPVYPVIMRAVKNNFSPSPTAVPEFVLGTERLTEEQYTSFLDARKTYVADEMRDSLLGKDITAQVAERMKELQPPTISIPPQHALPSVTIADVANGGAAVPVVEATLVDDAVPFDE